MNLRLKAVFATLLALAALSIGAWAEFWPLGFFRSFPVPGHPWVSGLGPYNEHLTRDFGALYLSLAVATAMVVKASTRDGYRLVGAAWSTFALLHLVFHLRHLDVFSASDAIGNVVVLGGQLLLGLLLMLPTPGSTRAPVSVGRPTPTADADRYDGARAGQFPMSDEPHRPKEVFSRARRVRRYVTVRRARSVFSAKHEERSIHENRSGRGYWPCRHDGRA